MASSTTPSAAGKDGAGIALTWLGHPITLISVAILLLNDHVLKAAFPGPVTGKLSDVAGLVFAPALLMVLMSAPFPRLPAGRLAAGSVLVAGAVFAWVKATAAGAALACDAWSLVVPGSMIREDRTDLVALPALLLAWAVWRAVRDRPLSGHVVRLARLLVVLPLAMVATGATGYDGPPVYPDAISVETVQSPQPGLRVVDAYRGPLAGSIPSNKITYNGGATWYSKWYRDDGGIRQRPRTRDCLPSRPAHCYKTVPGRLAVQETRDGGRTWTIAWQVPESRRLYLKRKLHGPVYSAAVAVQEIPGYGHAVIVANRSDGFAVRYVTGKWERLTDDRLYQDSLTQQPVGDAIPGYSLTDRDGLLPFGWLSVAFFGELLASILVFVVATVLTAVLFATNIRRGLRSPWFIPVVVLLPVATASFVLFPYFGWARGVPGSYTTATIVALTGGIACLPVIVTSRRWAFRRR